MCNQETQKWQSVVLKLTKLSYFEVNIHKIYDEVFNCINYKKNIDEMALFQ